VNFELAAFATNSDVVPPFRAVASHLLSAGQVERKRIRRWFSIANVTEILMTRPFQQMGFKVAAGFTRRLGTGLRAGVGVLKLLELESRSGSAKHQWKMQKVVKKVSQGELLAEALSGSDGYFPTLLVQMVQIGESAGRLERTLLMLADFYDHRVQIRRDFLQGIAWPMIQLFAAIMVIGLVIWIQGVLAGPAGPSFDASGLGLSGTSGLLIYFGCVSLIAVAISAVIIAVRMNFMGVHQLVPYAYKLPVAGPAIQTISLSRICWTLSLTLDSGLDAMRSIRMSLASAGSKHYEAGAVRAEQAIRDGATLTGALTAANVFPEEFIHAIEVAEVSGTDAESLERLAAYYDERAKMAMRVLNGVLTGVIWMAVTLLLVFFIIRMGMQIMGVYDEAAAPI
jgi:type IV pilus assembly protein PilC